jgi:NAD(P)-dependent dehydrogenase (short-subunit alcohol dehydrogenase family)
MDVSGPAKAVVTGAGSGLGRSIALVLARRGWTVGLVDKDASKAEVTLGMVRGAGGDGVAVQCDVTDPAQVTAMADGFFERWGEVNMLVNDAGVIDVGRTGAVLLENWRRSVEVDLMGVIYGCHSFVGRMKTQSGRAHIVNIGSLAGIATLPEMGPYNVAKAGVIALSETLRVELAPYGIGVTVVCPSFFNSNLLETATYTDAYEEEFAHITFENARMTSDDIAERTLIAVGRGKLYVLPQMTARLMWLFKRLLPGLGARLNALTYRLGLAQRIMLFLAKRGLA